MILSEYTGYNYFISQCMGVHGNAQGFMDIKNTLIAILTFLCTSQTEDNDHDST